MDELAEEIAVRLLNKHEFLNYPNFHGEVDNQQRTKEGKLWFKNQVKDCLTTELSQTKLEAFVLLVRDRMTYTRRKQKFRASFARFYFVDDEVLSQFMDNRNNISRLQVHFKTMFAGVAALLLSKENKIVRGIVSKEGEELMFNTPVSAVQYPKISAAEWLTKVEQEMRVTLAQHLADAVHDIRHFKEGLIDQPAFMSWCDRYEAQIVVLATQIVWSEDVEAALQDVSSAEDYSLVPVERVLAQVESALTVLADSVVQEQPALRRRKLEQLIAEFVHKRTVTQRLIQSKVTHPKAFEWLCQMRFYFDPKQTDTLKQLSIHMGDAKFQYGFEYLGVQDRLIQTVDTEEFFLTMTQALESRLGGSLFGPAGTGKTESVKALGHQLGRFVLVFNCDETFDFEAMGRIFIGLCQIGAWGCFDEFNRLEERKLSAVSQQVQTIQEALKSQKENKKKGSLVIKLDVNQVKVSQDMAIFITMNPDYAGHSNLPDNLKNLFRSLAITSPDQQHIAEVMLFSNGFRTADQLAQKIVPFFKLCDEQLSHYDFGLRALKSVLVSAGNLLRDRIQKLRQDMQGRGETSIAEQEILIHSVRENLFPNFVAADITLLNSLLIDERLDPLDSSLTAMEVVREIRKSMDAFFTPMEFQPCSNIFQFPSSTPHNYDLYMTLDVSPEEEPVRRKKSSGGGSVSASSAPAHESIIATPDEKKKRVVHKQMNSASTQTSPGVMNLPAVFRRHYMLRSGQGAVPPVIELSPDIC